jgi:hypothetical protein
MATCEDWPTSMRVGLSRVARSVPVTTGTWEGLARRVSLTPHRSTLEVAGHEFEVVPVAQTFGVRWYFQGRSGRRATYLLVTPGRVGLRKELREVR